MIRQAEDACRACHGCTCLERLKKRNGATLPDRGSMFEAPEPRLPHGWNSYLSALSDPALWDYDRAFSI
ncbi:hypothetical protein IG631_09613 [Alternaria alternata]|nr:hypothetical protein IG631_09613 [Alternaria alternata]